MRSASASYFLLEILKIIGAFMVYPPGTYPITVLRKLRLIRQYAEIAAADVKGASQDDERGEDARWSSSTRTPSLRLFCWYRSRASGRGWPRNPQASYCVGRFHAAAALWRELKSFAFLTGTNASAVVSCNRAFHCTKAALPHGQCGAIRSLRLEPRSTKKGPWHDSSLRERREPRGFGWERFGFCTPQGTRPSAKDASVPRLGTGKTRRSCLAIPPIAGHTT